MTSENRPQLAVVRPEIQIRALEAVRLVADEYGFPTGILKPCIAFLLDGNIGDAARHEAAFVIAIECRRLGLSDDETKHILIRWAKKIGYNQRQACGPIRNAYLKNERGTWKYHPPGIQKKQGSGYERVLSEICAEVGCPANCAPFAHLNRGPRGQGFEQFERLGWPRVLRKQRHAAAIDYYRAVCQLERQRGLAAGAPQLTSYRQLAELAGHDYRHAGDNLRVLYTRGLLTSFERGSGSGPKAGNRLPTRVTRAVPIPGIPPRYTAAITTGGGP
jgi:hypothetical protein